MRDLDTKKDKSKESLIDRMASSKDSDVIFIAIMGIILLAISNDKIMSVNAILLALLVIIAAKLLRD